MAAMTAFSLAVEKLVKRGRLTLLLFWIIPFPLYALLLIFRPWLWREDLSSSEVREALWTIGQVFIPISVLMLSSWIFARRKRQLPTLTKDRFWVAFGFIFLFHSITVSYFFVHVFLHDFAIAESYAETFEGAMGEFAKLSVYLTSIVLVPIAFLFSELDSI
jgi:hypothetical protein